MAIMFAREELWCLKENEMGILRTDISFESNLWSESQGQEGVKDMMLMLGFNE